MSAFKTLLAAAAISVFALGGAQAEEPMKRALSLKTAQKMVDACIAVATQNKWAMQIAVMDSSAQLLAFAKMDGAAFGSQDVALAKAKSVVNLPIPTSVMGKIAFDEKTGLPTPLSTLPGAVFIAGGVPIVTAAGENLGGVGVSGSMPENDETCAKAAADVILKK